MTSLFFSDLINKMYLIKKNYLTLIWKNLKPYWHHYFPFWSGQTLGWDAKDRWLEWYWSSEVEWLVHITSRSNPNIQTMFQQFVKLQEDRLHSSIAARWEAGSWSAECPSTGKSADHEPASPLAAMLEWRQSSCNFTNCRNICKVREPADAETNVQLSYIS